MSMRPKSAKVSTASRSADTFSQNDVIDFKAGLVVDSPACGITTNPDNATASCNDCVEVSGEHAQNLNAMQQEVFNAVLAAVKSSSVVTASASEPHPAFRSASRISPEDMRDIVTSSVRGVLAADNQLSSSARASTAGQYGNVVPTGAPHDFLTVPSGRRGTARAESHDRSYESAMARSVQDNLDHEIERLRLHEEDLHHIKAEETERQRLHEEDLQHIQAMEESEREYRELHPPGAYSATVRGGKDIRERPSMEVIRMEAARHALREKKEREQKYADEKRDIARKNAPAADKRFMDSLAARKKDPRIIKMEKEAMEEAEQREARNSYAVGAEDWRPKIHRRGDRILQGDNATHGVRPGYTRSRMDTLLGVPHQDRVGAALGMTRADRIEATLGMTRAERIEATMTRAERHETTLGVARQARIDRVRATGASRAERSRTDAVEYGNRLVY